LTPFTVVHGPWLLLGLFPDDHTLKLVEFPALAEIAAQLASDPEDSVHTPHLALRQKSPTGEAAVTEQDITLSEMLPKPLQESKLLGSQGLLGPGDDHARAQAHHRQQAKDWEAAPRLLDGLLGKSRLVWGGVSSTKGGAVDDLNPP
jgi:hypothetical protein